MRFIHMKYIICTLYTYTHASSVDLVRTTENWFILPLPLTFAGIHPKTTVVRGETNFRIIKLSKYVIPKKPYMYVYLETFFRNRLSTVTRYSNQTLILTKNKKTLNKRINRSGYFLPRNWWAMDEYLQKRNMPKKHVNHCAAVTSLRLGLEYYMYLQ